MYVTICQEHPIYTFDYADYDVCFSHKLTCPINVTPTADALFRIALYARPKNSTSYTIIGLEISDQQKTNIEASFKCEIRAKISSINIAKNIISDLPRQTVLCFSGGFDSIAASALLGESAQLISIDFGGEFSREAAFFKKFNTSIFEWELRGKRNGQTINFNEKIDWKFLLSPALCFQQNEPLGIATGTIMESSPWWFSGHARPEFKSYPQHQFGHNTALINPVGCISEFGTTLIAKNNLSSEALAASLTSLAASTSFKFFRKKTLLSIVNESTLPTCPTAIELYKFGTSYTDDIVALYVAYKAGKQWTESNYCRTLPDNWEELNMSFFEVYNVENLKAVDNATQRKIANTLKENGLKASTPQQLLDIELVNNFIKNNNS